MLLLDSECSALIPPRDRCPDKCREKLQRSPGPRPRCLDEISASFSQDSCNPNGPAVPSLLWTGHPETLRIPVNIGTPEYRPLINTTAPLARQTYRESPLPVRALLKHLQNLTLTPVLPECFRHFVRLTVADSSSGTTHRQQTKPRSRESKQDATEDSLWQKQRLLPCTKTSGWNG